MDVKTTYIGGIKNPCGDHVFNRKVSMSACDDWPWRAWLCTHARGDDYCLCFIKEYDHRLEHYIETGFELTFYDPALYTEFCLKWL